MPNAALDTTGSQQAGRTQPIDLTIPGRSNGRVQGARFINEPAFNNVSKSACKEIPPFLWSRNWPCSSNGLNVRARRPPNSCETSTSLLYGTNRVPAHDYVLIQSSTKLVIRTRHRIHRPTPRFRRNTR